MKIRDSYFDNLKFILIVLVVVGHFIEPLQGLHPLFHTAYLVIYAFHMPAFVFVSGHLCKVDGSFLKVNSIKKFLLPYLGIQCLYWFLFRWGSGGDFTFRMLLTPFFTYWYLLSLFTWQLVLPLIRKIPRGRALVFAFILGAAVGYLDPVNSFLSLSRSFVFFPFFLLGNFMGKEELEGLRNYLGRVQSLFLFMGAALLFYLMRESFDSRWLWGSIPYGRLHSLNWYDGFFRLLLYLAALLLMGGLLSLVPKRRLFFTEQGSRTLPVYLTHGIIVRMFYLNISPLHFSVFGNVVLLGVGIAFLISFCASQFYWRILGNFQRGFRSMGFAFYRNVT